MPSRLVVSVAALGLWVATAAAAADLALLKQRGVLRVGVAEGGLQDQFATRAGLPPGFEREILDLFVNLQDLRLEVVVLSGVAQKYLALEQGRVDLVASSTVTEDRQAAFDYSDIVFPSRFVVVSRKPAPAVTTLEALRAARVATIPGSGGADEVHAAGVPEERIDYRASTPEVIEALRSGHVTAAVTTSLWAFAMRKQDPTLEIGLPLGPPTGTAFAVAKGSPELLSALNEILLNVRRSGKWNHLVVKYYGADALKQVAALRAR